MIQNRSRVLNFYAPNPNLFKSTICSASVLFKNLVQKSPFSDMQSSELNSLSRKILSIVISFLRMVGNDNSSKWANLPRVAEYFARRHNEMNIKEKGVTIEFSGI